MPDNKDFDEISVLQRLQVGDETAFLELYDHYKKPLYLFILKFVKVPTHADDLLQDLFMKIWEIHGRINTELSFKAYLYRICRNLIFKFLKKTAGMPELLSEQMEYFIPDQSANAEIKLQWKEYEKNMLAAIDHLPARRKEVFILCRQGRHSYDDVAAQLGISRNTVKEHMVLAMKSISKFLLQEKGINIPAIIIFLHLF